MGRIEEELPSESELLRTGQVIQGLWRPRNGPKVGTDLCRDAGAFIKRGLRSGSLFRQHDVNVIEFWTRIVAVDAFPPAHVRVVGVDHESRQAHHRALANGPNARQREQSRQLGTIRRQMESASKGNVRRCRARLQRVEMTETQARRRPARAEIVLRGVLCLLGIGGGRAIGPARRVDLVPLTDGLE